MVRGRPSCMRRLLGTATLERGLYSGLARGVQKLQKRPDALGPGRLVVLGAFDSFVVQVAIKFPAFFEEHVTEFLDFVHDARAFARADVQPDARAAFHNRSVCKTVDHVLVPPDGGREGGNFPKNARMLEPHIEGNEASQRRTADAGVLRAGERAVFSIDERLYLFDEEFRVAVGAAAAELGHVSGSVFANARLGVVHANDDERSDRAGLNAMIGGLADVPILTRDEGYGPVEKILAIVKIEDREMTRRLIGISRRRVNHEIALVAEKARAEFFVFAELSGTHGAIITRRSFASTCCPEVTRIFTMRPEIGA